MQFSLDSAFYVFNLVANWAYSRWDAIYPGKCLFPLYAVYPSFYYILSIYPSLLSFYPSLHCILIYPSFYYTLSSY
jgi:hypothetical protein